MNLSSVRSTYLILEQDPTGAISFSTDYKVAYRDNPGVGSFHSLLNARGTNPGIQLGCSHMNIRYHVKCCGYPFQAPAVPKCFPLDPISPTHSVRMPWAPKGILDGNECFYVGNQAEPWMSEWI